MSATDDLKALVREYPEDARSLAEKTDNPHIERRLRRLLADAKDGETHG